MMKYEVKVTCFIILKHFIFITYNSYLLKWIQQNQKVTGHR
jgi:hypothetical protein